MSIQTKHNKLSSNSCFACGCPNQPAFLFNILLSNLADSIWPLRLMKRINKQASNLNILKTEGKEKEENPALESKWQEFDESLFTYSAQQTPVVEAL